MKFLIVLHQHSSCETSNNEVPDPRPHSTGDQIQGLMYVGQVLYYLTISSAPYTLF